MKRIAQASIVVVTLAIAACAHTVKVAPVQVEPIHITIDVNLHDPASVMHQAAKR